MSTRTDLNYARELDEQDELARFRDAFVIEDPDLIYLDGNSLGRLPKRTVDRMRKVVEGEWGGRLVRGWNEGWFSANRRIGEKIARLIGAEADEVIIADSTSVNLYKLVMAALHVRPNRQSVVTDDLNFPSDLYVLQGALQLAGPTYRLGLARSTDGLTISDGALGEAINEDTALVALAHATFKSGFVYDMERVTAMAHRAGALMLWDLCHSVGVVPISLSASGVDLAVGCTYKYLNGGPGAPAFLFVRRELQDELLNPIWGWFGHRAQFDFAPRFEPAPGIARFQSGTPPILSLSAVEPGVDLVLEAGLDRLRAKSIRQTEHLIALWQEHLQPLGITLNSPREANRRGSHVSFGHPDGLRIARALIEEMHVVPDFRSPDTVRFGVSPLYTTFRELHEAVVRLARVVSERRFSKYAALHTGVT